MTSPTTRSHAPRDTLYGQAAAAHAARIAAMCTGAGDTSEAVSGVDLDDRLTDRDCDWRAGVEEDRSERQWESKQEWEGWR